ncbi:methyltransferase domain-containing protein [Microvirga sp. GCM10011540]|uniref:methyltransferase domain-containing protein n=1 Tax=Microvirga sp. GCM10011540 TaxID=3317338 RepID=UPI0036098021
MHWKFKASIQNAISTLPHSVSFHLYYWMQRHFGELRQSDPLSRLHAGVHIWQNIQSLGHDPKGKVFFEVGTGRTPVAPLAFWLMGARRIVTVDLNPYLKGEIVKEHLAYISNNQDQVRGIFGNLLCPERLDALVRFSKRGRFEIEAFLALCRIEYVAPGDAARTDLQDGSVDFHMSYTTLEHIPEDVLRDILKEGNRIVKRSGLFVHCIDYSDHFWHVDQSIPAINFLQYSDRAWEHYAGNRYMYMNRLRHDDFLDLFRTAGHRLLKVVPEIDPRAHEMIAGRSFRVDDRFAGKTDEILSTINSLIISRKAGPAPTVASYRLRDGHAETIGFSRR